MPARPQSGITVSDELIALYESVKIRKTHKYILFSLQKADAAGKSYNWSIDVTADPVAATDADANKVCFHSFVITVIVF